MGVPSVLACTPYGVPLKMTKFASNVKRSFLYNGVGDGSMMFPVGMPDLKDYIDWGNIIKIYEDGVPPWVGVVFDRQWKDGVVEVQLKSLEWLLSGYTSGLILHQARGSIAPLYALVHEILIHVRANAQIFPLSAGVIEGSQAVFKEWHYKNFFEALTELSEEHAMSFWVDDNLKLNFTKLRGVNKTETVTFFENKELIGVTLSENVGDTVNQIIATSDQGDLRERLIKGYQVPGPYSRARVVEFPNIADPTYLEVPAANFLNENRNPRIMIDCQLANEDGAWAKIAMGDYVRVAIVQGLDPASYIARIEGMEVDETGLMRLVFKAFEVAGGTPTVVPTPWTP